MRGVASRYASCTTLVLSRPTLTEKQETTCLNHEIHAIAESLLSTRNY